MSAEMALPCENSQKPEAGFNPVLIAAFSQFFCSNCSEKNDSATSLPFFVKTRSSVEGSVDTRAINPVLARSAGYESFTVVVEIKKPQTPIFAEREYRSGVPGFSPEFMGGVSQAQVNSRTWDTEGSQRLADRELLEKRRIFTIVPLSILVIGSLSQLEKAHRRQSFELFRRNVHNPDILTFDELFERAKYIVQAEIESSAEEPEDFLDDNDIPF